MKVGENVDPTEGKPTINDTNSNEYAVHSETVQVNVRYVVAIRPCRSKKTMYNSESTFYTTSYIGITKPMLQAILAVRPINHRFVYITPHEVPKGSGC